MSLSDEIIKLSDYFFEKTKEVLPNPVFKWPSILYGLQYSGIIVGVIFLIGCITSLVLYFTVKPYTLITRTTYDKKTGKKIDIDKETKNGWKEPKDKCEREYKNDIMIMKKCQEKKLSKMPLITFITTLILCVVAFVQFFYMITDWHYGRALRFANPYHKTLIDYLHRYILPVEFSQQGILYNNTQGQNSVTKI